MPNNYDAVIIGAGLGGLSAGAFLARAGLKVLVLERSGKIGGKCRSVELMGRRFDPGADYFGRKILARLAELGKEREAGPVYFKTMVFTEDATITIPPGLHTFRDLRGLGMGVGDMARLGFRVGRQLGLNSYGRMLNNFQVINAVTDNRDLRDIFNIGAFFSGNDPENMPSHWFNLLFGRAYGYNRPFYPKGGSGVIPRLFADVIAENGGAIVFGAKVKRITAESGRASRVVLEDGDVKARAVISNAGILSTVEKLAGRDLFPYGFLNTLGYYREGLSMASLFVVFRRVEGIRDGVHIYARMARNLRAAFRVLGEGRFPERPMFILSCPDAVNGAAKTDDSEMAGTVKFLVPKGGADRSAIEAEAEKVVDGLEEILPGFGKSIVDKMLFTPEDYRTRLGFASSVTPVAESVHYEKFPVNTPLPGLYCVGSTVLPVGGCTVSAVESGAQCARMIIKELGAEEQKNTRARS